MCPYFRKNFAVVVVASALLTGCTGSVRTGHMGKVKVEHDSRSPGPETASAPIPDSTSLPPPNKLGEKYDADAEQTVSERVLKAWRVATSHDKHGEMTKDAWDKQRKLDEKESIAQLDVLEKSFPSQSSILLMKGQVYEHFGNHEQAIKHYRESSNRNLVNSMSLFKLAEEERKADHIDQAIIDYRRLAEVAPGFPAGQVGLARCLLLKDPKSAEAKKLIKSVLEQNPDDKDAAELMQKITG